MKLFVKYFNRHHLFKKPHKFLLALLLSPIHAAEVRYKKKYHLRFAHARKLFLFDIILLLGTIAIGFMAIFWHCYDPSVTKMVNLKITVELIEENSAAGRIESGDKVKYTIEYDNYSDTNLVDNLISLKLPQTFLMDNASLPTNYNQLTDTYTMADLNPGDGGSFELSGTLYGNVDEHYDVLAVWSYRQAGRSSLEQKTANIISLLPDSKIKIEIIAAPDKILSNGKTSAKIAIVNNGKTAMENIAVDWNQDNELEISSLDESKNPVWQIEKLDPGERLQAEIEIISNLTEDIKSIDWRVIPSITVNDIILKQKSASKTFQVVTPEANIAAAWSSGAFASFEQPAELNINIVNNGDIDLRNLSVLIALDPTIVDIGRTTNLNAASYSNGYLTINQSNNSSLAILKTGQSATLNIKLAVKNWITGITDPSLSCHIILSANVEGIENAIFEKSMDTSGIDIGTNLDLSAASRYYTDEGDQLGRGPLPPRVNKETKYWAIINIYNSSGAAQNLYFKSYLPEYIDWTDRSSVSRGENLTYNSTDRSVSWFANTIEPHAQIGLYMELSFTPREEQIGTAPALLQNISVTAVDNLTGLEIHKYIDNIDISLPTDEIGRSKGVFIVN